MTLISGRVQNKRRIKSRWLFGLLLLTTAAQVLTGLFGRILGLCQLDHFAADWPFTGCDQLMILGPQTGQTGLPHGTDFLATISP